MKEFKGTKQLEIDSELIIGDDILVCEMLDYNEENKANAKLFLASYDLLKALQTVVIAIESMDFQEGTLFKASHHKAIKAINKALN